MKGNIAAIAFCLICAAWTVFIGIWYGAAAGAIVGAIYSISAGRLMFYVVDDIRHRR